MRKLRSAFAGFLCILLLISGMPGVPSAGLTQILSANGAANGVLSAAIAEGTDGGETAAEAAPEEQTQAPTAVPTEAPTKAPTPEPVVTEAPSAEPTETQTSVSPEESTPEPSETPSDMPSESPSVEPSESPSATPEISESTTPSPTPGLVTAITLSAETTTIAVGDTLLLSVAVEPLEAAAQPVSFASGDETIATVDETGLVTGAAEGQAVITATAQDGSGVIGAITITVLSVIPFAGEGTAESPYELTSSEDMHALTETVANGDIRYINASYKLTADISLDGQWLPIGTAQYPFTGNFDGQGHKIYGLNMHYVNGIEAYGLFGIVCDANLTRIAVEDASLSIECEGGLSADVGLIAGRMENSSLSLSYSTGSVSIRDQASVAGGLTGRIQGGSMTNCFSLATVHTAPQGGILAGVLEDGAVLSCCYQRSDPLAADIVESLGDAVPNSGVSVSHIYSLTDKDKSAKTLTYSVATTAKSYQGYDFTSTWTIDANSAYPFPTLIENPYSGVATHAAYGKGNYAMGNIDISRNPSINSNIATDSLFDNSSLPSAYDLRNYKTLPAVRTQGDYGTCWSFAIVASLETNLIMRNLATSSINLSEAHTVWFVNHGAQYDNGSQWDDPLNNFNNDHPELIVGDSDIFQIGGSAPIATFSYAAGLTPCKEDSKTSYTTSAINNILRYGLSYSTYAFSNNRYHIQNAFNFSLNNIDTVKQMVMNNGSVAIGFQFYYQNYLTRDTYAYYQPPNAPIPDGGPWGHAVSIIGWDDNYLNTNFVYGYNPSKNGAWLVRNSWGSSFGNSGCFWISYYTDSTSRIPCLSLVSEAPNLYDYCYQYDGACDYFDTASIGSSNTVYMADVYTVDNGLGTGTNQLLTDVGFFVTKNSASRYAASIYLLNDSSTSPTDGILLTPSPTTGYTGLPGFYKVPVNVSSVLSRGDRFSVVVKLTSSGGTQYFDIDSEYIDSENGSYNSYSYAKKGQSFVSANGSTWVDLNPYNSTVSATKGMNLRVKAYSRISVPVTSVTISAENNATTVAVGSAIQLNATVLPSTANQKVIWSVTSGGDAASIDANGVLTGTGSGDITVTATTVSLNAGGIKMTATINLSVYIAATGVTVSPANVRVLRDTTARFTASVSPTGVGQTVKWSIQSGAAYATINASTGVLNANAAGSVTVAATSDAIDINGNQVKGTAQVEVFVPVLEFDSLSVSKEPTLGETVNLNAKLLPADAIQSVTYSVINGTGAATVDASGRLTCTRAGTVTVTATSVEVTPTGEHLSQSIPLTIHPNVTEVVVRPSVASLADANGDIHVSQGQQFTLTGSTLPADAVQRISGWQMNGGGLSLYMGTDHNILSLTASKTITTPSTSTVTATSSATMANKNYASKTLSITIHTPVSEIAVHSAGDVQNVTIGKTLQMNATITPEDAYQGMVWSVTNGTGSATITRDGLLTPQSLGTVTVTATACTQTADQQTPEASKVITIRPYATGLTITAADNSESVTKGATVQMSAAVLPSACEQSVVWSVINGTGSATIDAATGLLTGVAGGAITVKAVSVAINSSGKPLTETKPMTVDVPVTDIALNTAGGATDVPLMSTLQCAATVTPSDANQAVRWSVQNGTGTATITSDGLLTGTKRGTVTVTLTSVGKTSANENLTVSREITVTRPTYPVTAISVSSAQSYAGIGLPNLQMRATLTPANATVQHVTWRVENGSGWASISADGVLTALAEGTVTVRATSDDGENVSGTKTITIRDIYITVTGAAGQTRLRAGASLQLATAITPAEVGTGAAYQWSLAADGASYAAVDQTGLLTAKAPLTAAKEVTVNAAATDGRARAGAYTVTVYPAVRSIVLKEGTADVTGGKVNINVTKMPEAGYMDVRVTADTLPADADAGVAWSLSPCDGATLTADGDTAIVRVTAGCSPTLTATAQDGTGVLSRTLINAYSGPVKVLISGNDTMSAGGKQTLTTAVYPLNTPDGSYTYSIVSGGGTILQDGTLTATASAAGQTIVVRATSIDPTVYADFTVLVQNAASSIQVEVYLDGEYQVIGSFDDLYIYSLNDEGIRVRITPLPLTASQDYTVYNQNPNICAAERIGTTNEYWIKPYGYGDGKIRIDSATKDFYIEVIVSELVKSIQISGPTGISLGKSIQLTADAQPATAFNRGVKWSIDGYKATAATITATGALCCRTAFSGALTVRATAADGGGTVATYNVYQMGSPSLVTVLNGDNSITTSLTLDCSNPEPITLHAVVQPETAYQDILWNMGSAKVIACAVDPETGDLSVTPVANGSSTITASTKEGSARKATVKINVITLARTVQPVGMVYGDESGRWSCSLIAGKSMTFKADIIPATTSNKKTIWSLATAYPGVSLSGSTLKTTTYAANQTVIIRGIATDGSGVGCECAVSIVTAGTGPIMILQDSENVTGSTVELDMAAGRPDITLSAQPKDATVLWSVSPTTAAKLVTSTDGSVTVTPLKTGILTMTATATDGSNVKASVKVSVVNKVRTINIAYPASVAAGKRIRPTLTMDPIKPSYQKIEWKLIGSSDPLYAAISTSTGEIKALSGGHSIQVQAFAWADARGLTKIPSNTVTVELTDTAVSSVAIYDQNGRDVSKKTISFRPDGDDRRFSAAVLPGIASGEILWTLSSNIAMTLTVDPDTNEAVIHATGNGSAILKASSQDGSGKYAQVTLKTSSALIKVVLVPENPVYVMGYSLKVSMTYAPYSKSIVRSTWEMTPKGDMSGYRIDEGDWHVNVQFIWDVGACMPGDSFLLTCTTSTGAYATLKIPVVSSPTSLDILQDGITVSKAQLPLAEGAEVSLTAAAQPDTAYQQFKWETLTPGIATITVDKTTGLCTVKRVGSGIATIRATAMDGCGKTAYVLITEP